MPRAPLTDIDIDIERRSEGAALNKKERRSMCGPQRMAQVQLLPVVARCSALPALPLLSAGEWRGQADEGQGVQRPVVLLRLGKGKQWRSWVTPAGRSRHGPAICNDLRACRAAAMMFTGVGQSSKTRTLLSAVSAMGA